VPLVLDEALHDLSGAALVRVLERLERMSGAVQLIVLTDDPAATAWAAEAGLERALLLTR
jgi:DNA repair ATPase RecN